MESRIQEKNLLNTLTILTAFTIIFQIVLLWINSHTTPVFDVMLSASISGHVLRSTLFVFPFLYFIAAQLFLYALALYFILYTTDCIGKLCHLSGKSRYFLGIVFWVMSVIFVAFANICLAPHSFFTNLLVNSLPDSLTSGSNALRIAVSSGGILLSAFLSSLIILVKDFYHRCYLRKHILVLVFFTAILSLIFFTHFEATPKQTFSATRNKPNVILVGIDAVRPDFIDYYVKGRAVTPFIDRFLQSSISFSDAYTPLARTAPSWTTVLTGLYPKFTHSRGNNVPLNTLNLSNTLPKYLQAQGYETLFGTDDTRYNNITKEFGFDKIITPPMGLNDFLIGTINDFPLSNLIVTTTLGRFLFPYSYANHAVSQTYDPRNYLQYLGEALHQREDKPIFLAVHFTISHWPYYWFNDHQMTELPPLLAYKIALEQADKQVQSFFALLQKNNLLNNAVVVLLSDHGVAMGLHGDRLTSLAKYQGDPANSKKVGAMRYAGRNKYSADYKNDYGIDTMYAYGSDVLSLQQTHHLLAIKSYGFEIGKPHAVSGLVSTLDITPTLLNLLNIPANSAMNGVSLVPAFQTNHFNLQRPFFMESTYFVDAIDTEKISPEKVLIQSLNLYDLDTKTGLIFYKPLAERAMMKNKQEAIIENHWMLARYPRTQTLKLDLHTGKFIPKVAPPFYVLVNLESGKWTTELDTPFAKQSPLASLQSQLAAFYGEELT